MLKELNIYLDKDFVVDNSSCGQHRKSIIEILIIAKIFYECKFINSSITLCQDNKPNPKLKILKHK